MSTRSGEEARNPNEDASLTRWLRGVADSAIILAVLGGVLYLLGYQVQIGDAARLGIPRSLLPETSSETRITIGFLSASLLLALALLVYFLSLLVFKVIPGGITDRARTWFGGLLQNHKQFYHWLAVLCIMVIMIIGASQIPIVSAMRYDDHSLPKLNSLKFKDKTDKGLEEVAELRFLTRNEGWIILKRLGQKEYLLIREESVRSLTLQSE